MRDDRGYVANCVSCRQRETNMSDSLHSVAHPVQAPRSNTEARPYARPVAGVRASAPKFVRPLDARSHVPASPEELPAVRFPMLESSPRATQADLDLPWVTAYLDAESSSDAPDGIIYIYIYLLFTTRADRNKHKKQK